jgi:hypothetical protein
MDASAFRFAGVAPVFGLCIVGGLVCGDEAEAQGIVAAKRHQDRAIHATLPDTLRDVLAHLPEGDAANARDRNSPEDFVTWCHEGTHFVNSRLSTPKTRGFYTLYGEGWSLPMTNRTTLADVAQAIPEELRGRTFKTYLVDSRGDWNAYPLYLMDEWIAYQHGSMVRQELGWAKRKETEDFMAELAIYSSYMVEVVARREPEYPVDELREFREFMLERSRLIADDFDSLPLVKKCALVGGAE